MAAAIPHVVSSHDELQQSRETIEILRGERERLFQENRQMLEQMKTQYEHLQYVRADRDRLQGELRKLQDYTTEPNSDES